jgi:tRNA threonylcarbamoyladenosine biosynthesis protein TsaB
MRLLVLATSAGQTSIFVGEISQDSHGFSSSACVVPPAGSQASDIYRCIDQALIESGLSDFDLVVFDAGPGAFTGVRIGCGVAQGLGFGKACAVMAISALEACAHAPLDPIHPPPSMRLVAIDARMGEVYFGAFDFAGPNQPLKVRLAAGVNDIATAIENFEAVLHNQISIALIGNAFEKSGQHPTLALWADTQRARFSCISVSNALPALSHAELVATTARLLIGSLGLSIEQLALRYPANLAEPLYVRNKVALDKTEQAQLRAINAR